MADNVIADAGSGGATFATDDVSGVHYPYAKLAFGAPDTATIVSDANNGRLPVRAETYVGTIFTGQKAVTTSAVTIGTKACHGITLKAKTNNTTLIYFGVSGVSTTTGHQLHPGESVHVACANINTVYTISTTSGSGVSWVGVI